MRLLWLALLWGVHCVCATVPDKALNLEFLAHPGSQSPFSDRAVLHEFDAPAGRWRTLDEYSNIDQVRAFYVLRDAHGKPQVLGFIPNLSNTGWASQYFTQSRAGELFVIGTGNSVPVPIALPPELMRQQGDSLFYVTEIGALYELSHAASGHWINRQWLPPGGFHSPGPGHNELRNSYAFDVRMRSDTSLDLVVLSDQGLHTVTVHLLGVSQTGKASIVDTMPLPSQSLAPTPGAQVTARGSHLWLTRMLLNNTWGPPQHLSVDLQGRFVRNASSPATYAVKNCTAGYIGGTPFFPKGILDVTGSLVLERDDGHVFALNPDGSIDGEIAHGLPAGALRPATAPSLYTPWKYAPKWVPWWRPQTQLPASAFLRGGHYSQLWNLEAANTVTLPGATLADRFVVSR